jgi:tetratricopeptide (TPR) repeat protein
VPWVRWSGGSGVAAVFAVLGSRRAIAIAAATAGVVAAAWAATAFTPAARARRLEGRAEILLRLGDVAAATSAFEQALALTPGRADLVARLAEARLAQGDLEGAAAVASTALAADPGQPLVAATLAQVHLVAGRPEAAWAVLGPALERIRGLPDATTRTRALLIAGRAALARPRGVGRGDAATLLEEAAQAGAAPEVPGPARVARADALVLLAGLALEAGHLDQGLAALSAAELAAPERDDVATIHARALEAAGRPDAAVERLARRVWWPTTDARQPRRLRDPAAAPALGELLVRLRRLAEADALATSLASGSGGADASAYVDGLVRLARDDPAGAVAAFARLAGTAPGAAWPLLLQAHAALRAGAPQDARALLEEALRREPERVEAELGLLHLDETRGDRAAVRTRAERLLDRPRARAAAVRALFAIYAQDKDARGAQERLEVLVARFPDDVAVRVDLAIFRVLAGDAGRGAAELEAAAAAPDLRAAFEALARAQEAGTDALEAIELLAALASREPRLAAARQVLAGVYARIGRPDLAARELDLAVAARPDDDDARLARARLAAAQGDRPRAIAELELLGRRRPDDPEVQGALAGVLLATPRPAQADLDRARPLLEAAVAGSPRRAEARARLGLLLALRGEDAAALAAFEAARALDPALPAAHQDAALLLARGDLPAARAALERAWAATSDPRYGVALAQVRSLLGDPRGGLELLAKAGGPGPEDAVARAMLLALAGDPKAAAAAAAAVIDVPAVVATAAAGLSPPSADAARAATLGALGALGWWHEVDARAAALAREPRPDPLETWWALRALGPAGDAGVRVLLARALALLDPASGPAGLALADALARAGRRDEALATLELVATRRPQDADVALRLASALDAAGDRRRAVEHARRAVEVAPGSVVALNDLAWLLRGDGARRDEAIELARSALRLAPRAAEVQDTLGWLLAQAGRLPEARERLAQAVAARPLDPGLRYHLAWTLARSGEAARARNHVEVALLSGAPFAERAEAAALARELASAEPVDPTREVPRRD